MRKTIAGITAILILAVGAPFVSFAETAASTAAADAAAAAAASAAAAQAAAAAAELQRQIDANNSQLEQLNSEIAQYQKQLDTTVKQKNTLQNTINQLALQSKQLTSKITLTKNQINTTQLQIKQLDGNITDAQTSIDTENAGLGEAIRRLTQIEKHSFALLILTSDGISSLWKDMQDLTALQVAVNSHVRALSAKKDTLTDTKTTAEQKKAQLLKQQQTLNTQQGSLSATKKAQSDLLAQTKNQEATYQAIIAQKKAQEDQIENALADLKGKYNVVVNVDQITPIGKGVLAWPLDSVRITQYFGNTAFASSGAYGGKGHNGMDFAASIGTPVRASLSGVVAGTGNTDSVRGCYSFGKWVMVKHNNGLSTMYSHFSSISVSAGQTVSTGQVLGYSGETGYATGPHLHFGVYVSSATQIVTLGSATNQKTACSNAVMPVAPLAAYLNPLNYLPAEQ